MHDDDLDGDSDDDDDDLGVIRQIYSILVLLLSMIMSTLATLRPNSAPRK